MNADVSPTLDDLAARYYEAGDGTRKGPTYLRSYAQRLDGRRQQPLRVLELGIFSGASLLIWRDYLPNATIVGVDIAEPPARVVGVDRIHVLRGSQDDPAVLDQAAVAAGGSFDIIIDDASHIGYLTKRSLLYLFPRWLAPGGCYVIEDFGTGFLADYPDGQAFNPPVVDDAEPDTVLFRSSQHGMVGVVKQLIDHTMQELMTGTRPYLAVERITIETNIAFIDKALQAGGPRPEQSAKAVLPAETMAAETMAAETMAAEMRGLSERVSQIEQTLERLRHYAAPLRWLRRLGPPVRK